MDKYDDDDAHDQGELNEEFQKLASLIPTIPTNGSLTELEFLEFVIAYIQQLQELLSHNSWNECLHQLTSSMKASFVSFTSPTRNLPLDSNSYHPRNPLSTIHLDTNVPHRS